MRILLDTCAFLWIALDAPELSATAREAFSHPDNDVYLSAASAWEIAVKHGLGRLALPEPPAVCVPRLREELGIEPLPIAEDEALHVRRLPPLHRDPFDRILVCQAILRGMTLLTPDAAIGLYPAPILW